MDPYAILQVCRDATKEQIKKAFYKLALIHHPDKCRVANANSQNMFVEIQRAYAALTNTRKRTIMDSGYDVTTVNDIEDILDKYMGCHSEYKDKVQIVNIEDKIHIVIPGHYCDYTSEQNVSFPPSGTEVRYNIWIV